MALQKRFQLLARELSAAFGIQADPIPWVTSDRIYRAEFVISDERPKAVQVRDRRGPG
jgi:hypothetical protein